MDEKMLIAFGNYVLSEERKQRYKVIKIKGRSLKDRLSSVSDGDLSHFKAKYQP
jgi:hypothetical protein